MPNNLSAQTNHIQIIVLHPRVSSEWVVDVAGPDVGRGIVNDADANSPVTDCSATFCLFGRHGTSQR